MLSPFLILVVEGGGGVGFLAVITLAVVCKAHALICKSRSTGYACPDFYFWLYGHGIT
jgi:hypothetical protein